MFLLFATVQEGAAEAGQGREEELVARVRYIREVEATNQERLRQGERWGSHLCQGGTVDAAGGCLESDPGCKQAGKGH